MLGFLHRPLSTQCSIDTLQAVLDTKVMEVADGGGMVLVTVTGTGRIKAITIDPALLKWGAKVVSDSVLGAVQQAASQAREFRDTEMRERMGLPD